MKSNKQTEGSFECREIKSCGRSLFDEKYSPVSLQVSEVIFKVWLSAEALVQKKKKSKIVDAHLLTFELN